MRFIKGFFAPINQEQNSHDCITKTKGNLYDDKQCLLSDEAIGRESIDAETEDSDESPDDAKRNIVCSEPIVTNCVMNGTRWWENDVPKNDEEAKQMQR